MVAAGAYAVQWHTVTNLEDTIIGKGLEIAPYAQSVSEFVDSNHRWPTASEVSLPTPPLGGAIRKVTVAEHGVLNFTLSGWTLDGWVTATFAPSIMSAAAFDPRARLSYTCVEVKPSSLAHSVCRQWGVGSLKEIESKQAQAFAEWERNREQAESDRTAGNTVETTETTETECDRIASHVSDSVLECVTRVDAAAGGKLDALMSTEFRNRPRLKEEVIAADAGLLAQYDRQCAQDWSQLAGQMIAMNQELKSCLQ
ncbi:MAG: hypothetical protein ABUS47_05210 [Steroidobacter sp.]